MPAQTEPAVTVREPERQTPVLATVDVLVLGGGPAGLAAAYAAAREGARTLLVERYGYLGGMMTGSYVVAVLGVGDGRQPRARGFTALLRQRLEPLGAVRPCPGPSGDYVVDAETLKWQAAEMLADSGARVLLHTLACDALLAGRRVTGVCTESKSGRRAILATVTVDCTADADIADRAGCRSTNETHDVTLCVYVERVDKTKVEAFKAEQPERYRTVTEEAMRLNGGRLPGSGRYLKGIDITDAQALTRGEIQSRHDAFAALAYLKTNLPGWENARIRETAPQIGVRQSRRILGGCTVTNADLLGSRHVEDGVARLGACLNGYALYDPPGLDYDIPYGCLVPADADGLLVAGRCLSADYLAANSLRLIVPCLATGEAAGVAAALAARAACEPRTLDPQRLRDALRNRNVYLG